MAVGEPAEAAAVAAVVGLMVEMADTAVVARQGGRKHTPCNGSAHSSCEGESSTTLRSPRGGCHVGSRKNKPSEAWRAGVPEAVATWGGLAGRVVEGKEALAAAAAQAAAVVVMVVVTVVVVTEVVPAVAERADFPESQLRGADCSVT